MYFKSLSVTAISLLASLQLSGVDAFPSFGLKNNLAVVHGGQQQTSTLSANYVSVFARDNEPDVDFELVPMDVKNKVVSLRKRGLSGCTITHTAIKGETCTQISKDYGIPRSQYLALNPSINSGCTNMWAGETYCVSKEEKEHKPKPKPKPEPKEKEEKSKEESKEEPKEEKKESSSSCEFKHTVTSSDTCTSVIKQYGVDRDAYLSANPSINSACTNMITGKEVCIPGGGYSGSSSSDSSSSSEAEKSEPKEDEKISQKTTHLAAKTKGDSDDDKEEEDNSGSDGWSSTEKPAEDTSSDDDNDDDDSSSSSSSTEKRKQISSGVPMTYYWIAQPQDYDLGGRQVSIKTCEGKTLGKTSVEYADALVMEGTGELDNKVVNLGACSCSNYNCFMEVDKSEDPYGLTSYGSALRPFITAAANDIPQGSKIYVPQLDGWELPGTGGKKHNGCLLVDDRGWSFSGKHIDFYVYTMSNYQSLNSEHGVSDVDVYEGGGCKLINYM
ncbi:hypothetical protein BDB00DRAFT_952523 [Zychaea mexicana]|uniref:uncharacterized protein n=1 Tax=Zychaea mexicana TaxID=64656 RepID=UPI0022FE58D1|nr:uncharacterized protein BDB00DRAFT_952523 [Zychaea mexicana]KAI9496902.1 hypothetical protein BDB00DRAFT_952523 [Zychaea mexicana]